MKRVSVNKNLKPDVVKRIGGVNVRIKTGTGRWQDRPVLYILVGDDNKPIREVKSRHFKPALLVSQRASR